jgi:hypothetical protein
MLINSPNISGSLKVTGNTVITGSLTVLGGINATITGSATTASYVEYSNVANKPTLVSGSSQVSFNGIVDKPTLVSGSSQVTYSGLSGIPSGILSSSAQVGGYGIFATTGSNTFVGSQTITGSIFGSGSLTINGCITATGQIVAQTINIQQVTSSIVYSCGSNIFGTSTSNTQQFTGSMLITGSNITANIGNACFAGTICSNTVSTTDGSNVSQLANNYLRSTAGNFYFDACTVGASFNFRTSNASALDSTAMFICGTNNRIGINCVTPGYALDVNGTFNVRTSTGSEVRIINYGGSSAKIRGTQSTLAIESCGAFTIESGGATERLRINENGVACFACQVCAPVAIFSGCVGIGTTSPGITLDVKFDSSSTDITGSGASSLRLLNTCAANTNNFHTGIWFRLDNGINNKNGYIKLINDATNAVGDFAFILTQSGTESERLRIKGNGCVSIGTTCTLGRLTINSSAGTSGITLLNDTAATSGTETQFITWEGLTNGGNLHSCPLGRIGVVNVNGGTSIGDMVFFTKQFNAGICERMRVTSGGNVGIGTTSPGQALQVNGRIRVSPNGVNGGDMAVDAGGLAFSTIENTTPITFQRNNFSSESMRITAGGNVGIGTTSPVTTTNYIFVTTNGSNGSGYITQVGGTTALYVYSNANDSRVAEQRALPLIFETSGTERMRITAGGIACFACQVCVPSVLFNTAGTSTLVNTNITATTCFGTSSRSGFTGLTDNCSGVYFGMGADGSGISAGIGFFREPSGWNSALAFYTNCITDGVTVPRIQERMRITSCGNVGIKSNSPRATLHVQQSTNDGTPVIGTARDGAVFTANNGNYGLNITVDPVGITHLQSMRFDGQSVGYNLILQPSACNVGIGTTNPTFKLEVAGTVRMQDTLSFTNGDSGQAIFTNNSTAVSVSTTTALGGSFSMGGSGAFVIVYGSQSTNVFIDTIIAANTGTPTVLNSTTVSGSPSARTYSTASNRLQLAMASGTYDVRINILRIT